MNEKILKNLNILITDDDEIILKQSKILLEDMVGNIYLANGADEALSVLQENRNIDVLITDIMMPKKNGIELIKEIKSKQIPLSTIIVVSAHSETNYLLEAIKLRVDGYLLKPLNLNELIATVVKSTKPLIQAKEMLLQEKILEAINIFVGGKKIEIIKYVYENSDHEGSYYGSYEDIMVALNVSKPTVVATFKQLIDARLIERIKNKHYKINRA